MKTLTFPVLVLLLIPISGCGDKDIIKGIDVSGYVLEYGTLEPIEGARVYLIAGISSVTDKVITDMSGRYEFKRPHRETGTVLSLYAFADDYYDIIEADVPLPWKKQEIDIVMDPYAWIKLHIKNTNPFDHNDLLSFSGEWGGGSLPDYYGMNVDLYYLQKVYGNRFIDIYWGVTKNNNFNFSQDSVFTVAHDTVDFEILY